MRETGIFIEREDTWEITVKVKPSLDGKYYITIKESTRLIPMDTATYYYIGNPKEMFDILMIDNDILSINITRVKLISE